MGSLRINILDMSCEHLDKRTNAYKECMKAQKFVEEATENGATLEDLATAEVTDETLQEKYDQVNSSGLGDVVEKITKATGIKKVVEMFTPEGKDCGCDERKKKLNKLRFRRTPLCLNAEEFKFLDALYKANKNTIGHTEGQRLVAIEERIFQKKYSESLKCASCIRQIYNDLRIIWETYL